MTNEQFKRLTQLENELKRLQLAIVEDSDCMSTYELDSRIDLVYWLEDNNTELIELQELRG